MGLLIMIAGLALFIGAHILTTLRDARAAAIARLGEGGYKIVYSLVSLAGIALWGITGVLIGTVASALISEIGDYTIACRHRFFQPLGKNLLRSYSFLALAAAEMAGTVLLCKLLPFSTGGVALRCLICIVLPNGINLFLFRKTDAFAQVMAYLKKIFNLVFHHVDPDAVEP